LATSTGYGTTTITATMNGVSATAQLTVTTPALTSIAVTPQSTTIYQGTAIQLKATGLYADGSSADLTNSVAWSSSDNTIATVSPQGLVQSLGLGTATISATGIVSGNTPLTVVAAFTWGATGSNGTSAAVSSGGAANFGLALAPSQIFTGLVTFACSNLPPNSTCTINPPSVDLANGTAVNVNVSITTGQILSGQNQGKALRWGLAFAIWPAFILLFPNKSYRWAQRLSVVILLFAVFACTSCGGSGGSGGSGDTGGSGGGTTPGATPSGTYTVVVTATSAEHARQNVNLTVVVQ
jgi:hypothetical protein